MLIVTAACLLICTAQTGDMHSDSKADKENDAAHVDWLKARVAPLKSIDPADEDFADLEPIRAAIADSRIVELSEQSHGDGATFHARTRLIKFLHQKCGFDVLAFESGFYDCRKAWELLRQGQMSPRQAISYGVFDIWTSSQQVQPLIEYLGQQACKSGSRTVFSTCAIVDRLARGCWNDAFPGCSGMPITRRTGHRYSMA